MHLIQLIYGLQHWASYLLINHVHVGSTIIAHAGDGNFHVIILFDPTNEKEVKEATDLSAGMVHLALEKEGTMG